MLEKDFIMSDLIYSIRKETWAYVGLLGLLALHLGIILSVLAFEGALEQHLTTFMEVFSIVLICVGFCFIFLSAYLRGVHKRKMRENSMHHNTKRKSKRCPPFNISEQMLDYKYREPTITCNSNKGKVFPWYSECSGPLPNISPHRNIEDWLNHQRLEDKNNNRNMEDINTYRLSSLV